MIYFRLFTIKNFMILKFRYTFSLLFFLLLLCKNNLIFSQIEKNKYEEISDSIKKYSKSNPKIAINFSDEFIKLSKSQKNIVKEYEGLKKKYRIYFENKDEYLNEAEKK